MNTAQQGLRRGRTKRENEKAPVSGWKRGPRQKVELLVWSKFYASTDARNMVLATVIMV